MVYVVGRRSSSGLAELRAFLDRNRVGYRWTDLDDDPLIRLLGPGRELDSLRLPVVVFPDGTWLEAPEKHHEPFVRPSLPEDGKRYLETSRWRADLSEKLGLRTRPGLDLYDVVILGGGPAGLTAAVCAASEGLRTIVVERHSAGGQAGTSARIENYPGFPDGVSGAELAEAAYEQALRFGAEILVGVEVLSGRVEQDGSIAGELVNGSSFRGRTAVVAPGVFYRRLEASGIEQLLGAGIYYGSAPNEAAHHRGGDVFIVGGANSAGQAALHLAGYARRVTLVVRADSLAKSMSRYLVERIERSETISVRTRARVTRVEGDGRLEAVFLAGDGVADEVRLPAEALFVLIGGEPLTTGVEGWLRRDEGGFLMTGPDLLHQAEDRGRWWPLDRDPLLLESSQPGVFVAGDVRHGSIKRVASAVGEGAMAVQLIHRYLGLRDAEPARRGATAV